MEPLFPAPLPPDVFTEFKDGETDFADADLFKDKDEEIEEGMLSGFSFTVGVFFKLLLCKSHTFCPPLPLLDDERAGEVLAEEGADLDPEEDDVLTEDRETLGDEERPEGEYDGNEFFPPVAACWDVFDGWTEEAVMIPSGVVLIFIGETVFVLGVVVDVDVVNSVCILTLFADDESDGFIDEDVKGVEDKDAFVGL